MKTKAFLGTCALPGLQETYSSLLHGSIGRIGLGIGDLKENTYHSVLKCNGIISVAAAACEWQSLDLELTWHFIPSLYCVIGAAHPALTSAWKIDRGWRFSHQPWAARWMWNAKVLNGRASWSPECTATSAVCFETRETSGISSDKCRETTCQVQVLSCLTQRCVLSSPPLQLDLCLPAGHPCQVAGDHLQVGCCRYFWEDVHMCVHLGRASSEIPINPSSSEHEPLYKGWDSNRNKSWCHTRQITFFLLLAVTDLVSTTNSHSTSSLERCPIFGNTTTRGTNSAVPSSKHQNLTCHLRFPFSSL